MRSSIDSVNKCIRESSLPEVVKNKLAELPEEKRMQYLLHGINYVDQDSADTKLYSIQFHLHVKETE